MRRNFTVNTISFRFICIAVLILIASLQIGVSGLWAKEKNQPTYSLSEVVERALKFRSEARTVDSLLAVEDVIFLVKK